MLGMNAAAYAEEGFNLNRITKDTLGQAYVGKGQSVSVNIPAASPAAEKSGSAAEKPAAPAKLSMAAKVPFPAAGENKSYTESRPLDSGKLLQDVVFFIPRVIVSVLIAPFALFGVLSGRVAPSRINLLYRIIW